MEELPLDDGGTKRITERIQNPEKGLCLSRILHMCKHSPLAKNMDRSTYDWGLCRHRVDVCTLAQAFKPADKLTERSSNHVGSGRGPRAPASKPVNSRGALPMYMRSPIDSEFFSFNRISCHTRIYFDWLPAFSLNFSCSGRAGPGHVAASPGKLLIGASNWPVARTRHRRSGGILLVRV
jgi:hypothetical protein